MTPDFVSKRSVALLHPCRAWIIGILIPMCLLTSCLLSEPPRPLQKATLDTPPAHLDVIRVGGGWDREPSSPPALGSEQPAFEDRSVSVEVAASPEATADASPPAPPQPDDQQASVDAAFKFADGKSDEWGLKDPKKELSLHAIRTDELGMTHVALQQTYRHIPVWNRGITLHVTPSGTVQQADGVIIPTPEGMAASPKIGPGDAMVSVGRTLPDDPDCASCQAERVIFVAEAGPRMAYRITAATGPSQRKVYFVDAESGDILQKQ